MSFSGDMDDAVRRIKEAHDKITRAATLDLFAGVIKSTPVDTGRARGNWQTSVGTPVNGTTERDDPAGSAAIAEVETITPDGAGQQTFMVNNLPYITALEYGHSKQAPAGMARINVARVRRIVDKAVAAFKV